MKLCCRMIPKTSEIREKLVSRLVALGYEPTVSDDSVTLEYDGNYDRHAMAIISVFESFGCDRAIVFKG